MLPPGGEIQYCSMNFLPQKTCGILRLSVAGLYKSKWRSKGEVYPKMKMHVDGNLGDVSESTEPFWSFTADHLGSIYFILCDTHTCTPLLKLKSSL